MFDELVNSFIALAFNIHVLRPEAEGAIMSTTRKVCRMSSEFKQLIIIWEGSM